MRRAAIYALLLTAGSARSNIFRARARARVQLARVQDRFRRRRQDTLTFARLIVEWFTYSEVHLSVAIYTVSQNHRMFLESDFLRLIQRLFAQHFVACMYFSVIFLN
jgi:hypothetical protein